MVQMKMPPSIVAGARYLGGYLIGFLIANTAGIVATFRGTSSWHELSGVGMSLAVWFPEVVFAYFLVLGAAHLCRYNKDRWPFAISGLVVSLFPQFGILPTYFWFASLFATTSLPILWEAATFFYGFVMIRYGALLLAIAVYFLIVGKLLRSR